MGRTVKERQFIFYKKPLWNKSIHLLLRLQLDTFSPIALFRQRRIYRDGNNRVIR